MVNCRAVLSFFLYLFDVGSDIYVGVSYILIGETWWGALTISLVAAALVITNFISLWRYVWDKKDQMVLGEAEKFFFVIAHEAQIGMLFR